MKKQMKILIALILTASVCLLLFGCGAKTAEQEQTEAPVTEAPMTDEATALPDNTASQPWGEIDIKDGVLYAFTDEEGNPKQTALTVNGVILAGNQHGYNDLSNTELIMPQLVARGYKTEGINSSFYLNEYIEVYADTVYSGPDEAVKIVLAPQKAADEYEKMSFDELAEFALSNGGAVIDWQTPDEENYKYIGEGYVNADFPAGAYDLIFTCNGEPAYYISLTVSENPEG